jgi:hypothetical protein
MRPESDNKEENNALSFKFKGVAEGIFLLHIGDNEFVPKSVHLNGRDISNDTVSVKTAENINGLRIVLTANVAVIKGRVNLPSGKPAARYAVLLVPVERSKQRSLIFTFGETTNADGDFEIKALPGEYYIAFPTPRENRITTEDYFEKISKDSQKVTLRSDKPTEMSLIVK